MSILEDIHAGLFGTGGEYDDDDDSGSTVYSSATASTTTTATGKTYISASTRKGVDDDTAAVYTRATEITEYTARKTKNNGSHAGKAKKVNSAAATVVSRYDDGRTVCTSATRGTNPSYSSATKGTKDTSTTSLGSATKYTGPTKASKYSTTTSDKKHTSIASHSTKGSDTSKRATLGRKKMVTVMEERDDNERIFGRTSYYDEGDDDDNDDTNTAFTVETGSTAAINSPCWTAFLHRADEENDTIISETAKIDSHYQPKANGFMTVVATRDDNDDDDDWTKYSKLQNTTMLTYSHGYDDHTIAATMHDRTDEGKNGKGGSNNKWTEMTKKVVSSFATWLATNAKIITTISPTDIIIPTKKKKKSLHSRKRATLVVVRKAQRKLCTC